jgi:hypothetical protein
VAQISSIRPPRNLTGLGETRIRAGIKLQIFHRPVRIVRVYSTFKKIPSTTREHRAQNRTQIPRELSGMAVTSVDGSTGSSPRTKYTAKVQGRRHVDPSCKVSMTAKFPYRCGQLDASCAEQLKIRLFNSLCQTPQALSHSSVVWGPGNHWLPTIHDGTH